MLLFFILACAITWLVDLPWVIAALDHAQPPTHALMLTGLGAWGPTIAALILAAHSHRMRDVFGRWRTNPIWVLIALFLPMALHLPATLIEVALGGEPAHWFYPPREPERIAALVMFSLGEEFGWRGYAYPRTTERFGPVLGSVLLGSVWGIWHLGMMFTPEKGAPAPTEVLLMVGELALYSILFAWVFERSNRSMLVAIALHAGGHLDNVNRAPESEIRLRLLRLSIVAIASALAARALLRDKKKHE